MLAVDDGPFDAGLYTTVMPPKDAWWKEHWKGMPEFDQPKQREYAKIIVRFKNQAALDDFCERIGQKLNPKSQCTWHPELPPIGRSKTVKRWVDGSKS